MNSDTTPPHAELYWDYLDRIHPETLVTRRPYTAGEYAKLVDEQALSWGNLFANRAPATNSQYASISGTLARPISSAWLELDAKLRDPKLTGVDRMYVYDEYANLQRQPYLAAHPIQAFFMPNGGFDNALGVAAAAAAVARPLRAPMRSAHVAEHCGGDGPIPRHDGEADTGLSDDAGSRKGCLADKHSSKVPFEQHPYHETAPDWHKGPHWHLNPGSDSPEVFAGRSCIPGM